MGTRIDLRVVQNVEIKVMLTSCFWHRVTHRNQAKSFPFAGFRNILSHIEQNAFKSRAVLFLRARYSKELAHTSFSMANVASDDLTVGRKSDALFLLSARNRKYCYVVEDGVWK